MGSPAYVALWLDRFVSATADWTEEEVGAYLRLLIYQAQNGAVPLDPTKRARIVRMPRSRFERLWTSVLAEKFQEGPEGFQNERMDEERRRALDHAEKQSQRALRRWQTTESDGPLVSGTPKQMRNARMLAAREKGSHTVLEWELLVSVCGGRCVRCGAEGRVVKDHIVPVYQGGSDALENVQPLCASCNRKKGAERIDHRPPGCLNSVRSVSAAVSATDGTGVFRGRHPESPAVSATQTQTQTQKTIPPPPPLGGCGASVEGEDRERLLEAFGELYLERTGRPYQATKAEERAARELLALSVGQGGLQDVLARARRLLASADAWERENASLRTLGARWSKFATATSGAVDPKPWGQLRPETWLAQAVDRHRKALEAGDDLQARRARREVEDRARIAGLPEPVLPSRELSAEEREQVARYFPRIASEA